MTANLSLRLKVAANFTVEPIGPGLQFWARQLAMNCSAEFAEYNQVVQVLTRPGSPFFSSEAGVNLLLIRPEEWARDQSAELKIGTIVDATSEFVDALSHFGNVSKRSTILLLCPPSQRVTETESLRECCVAATARIEGVARSLKGIHVIPAEQVSRTYPVELVDDEESNRQGHIPFTADYWAAAASAMMRAVRCIVEPPLKVIAVDADNTLWAGVVGEVGATGVLLDGPWRILQATLSELKRRGVLLALVSKNAEEDVAAVFERPDMLLKRSDFVTWRVNWQPKSRNIQEIAAQLDLGLDSFLFLDDNPMECAEVSGRIGSITTLQVPSAAEIPTFLRHTWLFDLPESTSADAGRTEQYRQQSERADFRSTLSSYREFIERLNVRIDSEPVTESGVERAAQLTQRTNQFNTSGVRWKTAELLGALRTGETSAVMVRLRDRFGDYGEVGLAIFRSGQGELVVENFLLSCRALGKGVEHTMLADLGRLASNAGFESVRIPFQRTARNEPALQFLMSVGARFAAEGCFLFSTEYAASVTFNPEGYAEHISESMPQNVQQNEAEKPQRRDFQSIAQELTTVDRIQKAMQRRRMQPRPAHLGPPAAPRGSLEDTLAKVWAEVLGLEQVGIHDSFFELGGDSIRVIELISKAGRLGIRTTLKDYFENPTIARLSSTVVSEIPQPKSNVQAKGAGSLARLGGRSLEDVLATLQRK